MSPKLARALGVVALVVVAVIAYIASRGGNDPVAAPSTPTPIIADAARRDPPRPPRPPPSATPRDLAPGELQLERIADRDERAAVTRVADDIDHGRTHGRRDGIAFENRERRLPARDRGYYREYTVPTPGEGDRGARRIISGADGELYYSRDHYRSFVQIRGGRGAPSPSR